VKLREATDAILGEISRAQEQIQEHQVRQLIEALLQARRTVVFGVGRMGLMSRAFVMRLAHLGLEAYMLGDCSTPAVGAGDLVLLNSGSGETQTVVDVAKLAKASGARLAAVTTRPSSTVGQLADVSVHLPGSSKADMSDHPSVQPMTTLNEQNLLVLLDSIVLLMMEATSQTAEDLWERHCNLE
jgi:6-phospho-3-hexuloisomerase